MTEGMPHEELARRALEWLLARRAENAGQSLCSLLDETGMRFNLSPKDAETLHRLLNSSPELRHEAGTAPDANRNASDKPVR